MKNKARHPAYKRFILHPGLKGLSIRPYGNVSLGTSLAGRRGDTWPGLSSRRCLDAPHSAHDDSVDCVTAELAAPDEALIFLKARSAERRVGKSVDLGGRP